eukprot:UN10401
MSTQMDCEDIWPPSKSVNTQERTILVTWMDYRQDYKEGQTL